MDPGVSLFSGGAEALQLTDNNQNQREEEEEALEDQRRRDQELKNLLTNAFDDLMDEEDDDDQSTVSSIQQNGFSGHHSLSNTGSTGSNQNSPHCYSYSNHNHIQSHSPLSPAQVNQFDMGVYSSPVSSQPVYDANKNGFDFHHVMSRLRCTSGSIEEAPTNGYESREELRNLGHITSNRQDADHFGYLSSIPHADLSGNENPLTKNVQCYNGNDPNEDAYRYTDLNSPDQFMVLYTTRMQEISQLRKELVTLRHERDSEVEQYKRKLLLVEAEKQGAFLSHKEAQNLLGDYQTQISQLRQESEDLRLNNITLEKTNEEVTRALDVAKAHAAELLQKVSILERTGKGLQSDKNVESFLRNAQQQYESQVRELQSQIESLTQRFSKKDHECSVMECKLREAHRSQEALMTEKGKIINELNKQLEEAQLRVREYAGSVDNEETMRGKIELDQMKADRKALEEKLTDTLNKLEAAERDLKQYESVAKLGLLGNGDSSFETDSITHLGISRRHSLGGRTDKNLENSKDSTRQSTKSIRERDDLNVQLRDELRRALQGQKSKREEIRRLQGELALRDQKIKTMKDQERVYFVEAEKFKKNLTAVLDRLKRQEEEAKALQGKSEEFNALQNQMYMLRRDKEKSEKNFKDAQRQVESMKAENDNLQEQLADMELQLDQAKVRQVDQSAAEFLVFHDESIARLRQESSRQLEAQVVDYRVRMEQAQKECEEIKRLYIEVCSAKRALLTELQEEQSRVKKLTSDLDDVKEAQQSLEELHKQERELNRRLREELEMEKSKISKYIQEKENQLKEETSEKKSALCEELEKELHEVQTAKDEAEARAHSLQKQVQIFELDIQNLKKLEVECKDLRKEAIEAPQRQQAELERISRELKQSRERVIQLEKRLRAEFQSQMEAMVAERDLIQAQLKQKDMQLEEYLQALSRMKPATREISVNTENGGSLEALTKQFDEKIAEMNAHYKAQQEQRLLFLEAQHKATMASSEEHVKEETVKYFAEEISKMEDKHRNELGAFAKKLVEMESTFTKHLTALKNALQMKSEEVQSLTRKLQLLHCNKSPVNGNKESDDPSQLRVYVEQLKKQTEDDRNKMTEALSRWANEVKELQGRETHLECKVVELKAKYKDARKAAIHYKKLVEEKDKHLANEWNRLQSAYGESLQKVQEKVADIVSGREQEVVERLKRIESYYEGQMKDLESRLKQEAVIS